MTTTAPTSRQVEITGDYPAVQTIVHEVLDHLLRYGYDDNAHFAVRLALDEALANAYDHGNRRCDGKKIRVAYEVSPKSVKVVVGDEGEGFDHRNLDDPRQDSALDKTHGRGIFLMQQFMSEVRFNEKGNEITLVYRRDRAHLSHWPGLTLWEDGGTTILSVPAELPACYSYVIGVCVTDLLETGHRRVVLDLSQHARLDPELIATLSQLGAPFVAGPARMAIVHPEGSTRRILREHGLAPAVLCYAELSAALAAFKGA